MGGLMQSPATAPVAVRGVGMLDDQSVLPWLIGGCASLKWRWQLPLRSWSSFQKRGKRRSFSPPIRRNSGRQFARQLEYDVVTLAVPQIGLRRGGSSGPAHGRPGRPRSFRNGMAEEVTMTWRKPLHDVAVQKIIDDCDAGKWDQSPIFRLPFEDLVRVRLVPTPTVDGANARAQSRSLGRGRLRLTGSHQAVSTRPEVQRTPSSGSRSDKSSPSISISSVLVRGSPMQYQRHEGRNLVQALPQRLARVFVEPDRRKSSPREAC